MPSRSDSSRRSAMPSIACRSPSRRCARSGAPCSPDRAARATMILRLAALAAVLDLRCGRASAARRARSGRPRGSRRGRAGSRRWESRARGCSASGSSIVRCGVCDQRDQRIDDLAEVVRRDVGRHADGDAGRAVDQQVRDARRQARAARASCRRSSAPKSTVSLSRSASSSLAMRAMRTSV